MGSSTNVWRQNEREKRGVDQLDCDLIKDKFEWHSGLIPFTRSLAIKGIGTHLLGNDEKN